MKRWGYWVVIAVVLVALVVLIGWANAYVPLMTSRASETWSRGRIVGTTPVSVQVDIRAASDSGTFLAWADLDGRLHVARLDAQGRVVADWVPALDSDVPREPRFLVEPLESEDNFRIHLVWRETGDSRSLLTYARLDSAGSVQVGPLPLSLPGDEAQSPHVAFNRRGGIEVFWVGNAGVYRATLSAEGEMQGEPTLLAEDGEAVSVQVDRGGTFHITWLRATDPREKVIYYATLDPEQQDLSQPEEMDRVFLRPGQVVQSLTLGIDSDTGFVLWVIQDMKYVTSSARYAFFPLEIPRQKKIRDLQLDDGGDPLSLWAMRGQHETLLVALTETVMTQDGPTLQIGVIVPQGERSPGDFAWMAAGRHGSALAIAQGGWPEDQYVVTASDHPSLKPSLAADARGNLHLTWLETGGFGVYRLAYASTAAEVRAAYNALNVWDITDRAMGIAMQLFLAVGLTPVLAITWSLFPLMWLLGYHLVTGRENLNAPGTWVALGVSVLLEVIFTYLIYPYRSSLPVALRWTLPLVAAVAALLLTAVYLRKQDERWLFGAFFVFAVAYGFFQVVCFVLLRL
jgi:hypothetical protein